MPLLADVIKYGRKCGRVEIDDFTFAVRQAHHPQGKQFLLEVLHNPFEHTNPNQRTDETKGKWSDNMGGSWEEARFHAAEHVGRKDIEEAVAVPACAAMIGNTDFNYSPRATRIAMPDLDCKVSDC